MFPVYPVYGRFANVYLLNFNEGPIIKYIFYIAGVSGVSGVWSPFKRVSGSNN